MTSFVSFIRGINVGGNNIVKMADFKAALEKDGFTNVKTYIQSGNVLFDSDKTDLKKHSKAMEQCLQKHFKVSAAIVTFNHKQWKDIIQAAPKTWGQDPEWKHNILIMLEANRAKDVLTEIPTIKPDIESFTVGKGVVYQSVSREQFTRSSTSRLAGLKIYQDMTIRNFNTATKLLMLLDERSTA